MYVASAFPEVLNNVPKSVTGLVRWLAQNSKLRPALCIYTNSYFSPSPPPPGPVWLHTQSSKRLYNYLISHKMSSMCVISLV